MLVATGDSNVRNCDAEINTWCYGVMKYMLKHMCFVYYCVWHVFSNVSTKV